jgi:hypothetical protein
MTVPIVRQASSASRPSEARAAKYARELSIFPDVHFRTHSDIARTTVRPLSTRLDFAGKAVRLVEKDLGDAECSADATEAATRWECGGLGIGNCHTRRAHRAGDAAVGRRANLAWQGRDEHSHPREKLASFVRGTCAAVTGLRVTVQLIDGQDGTRRWSSRPYEHEQSAILAAQDEIAQDAARALSVTLDVGALNRAQGVTMNLEAARRYWEWRELQVSDRGGLDLARQEVRLMREAVRLDPQFLVAWDGLAGSLRSLAYYVGDKEPQQAEQLRAEAEQAWRRVAELAPDSWVALKKKHSDDLLRAEKWAESEAVAKRLLESAPFTLERAQPLTTCSSPWAASMRGSNWRPR